MQTASRVFFVKKNPDVSGKKIIHNIRFYIYRKPGLVLRIQSVDNAFELERKVDKSELLRSKDKISITKGEFDVLRRLAKESIVRDNCVISESPEIILRIYRERFKGLSRIEVKFKTIEEANAFIPYSWFGKEITNSPLGKDNALLDVTHETFKMLIKEANLG